MLKIPAFGNTLTVRCNFTATPDKVFRSPFSNSPQYFVRIIVFSPEYQMHVGGHKRFNELQRTINGISARVLSNELKQLELNGLLKSTVQADKFPPIVEYMPTEYAATLKDVVSVLAD